jgi:hypothetical protein
MLRSAATPNRTDVQPKPEMKHPTTQRPPRRRPGPGTRAAHLPSRKEPRKLSIAIRLFKD